MQPPFVSSVTKTEIISAGKPATFYIKGNWPTPSWKHDKTTIEINEATKVVKVSYLGITAGGIAMQVLKPFSDTITIEFPNTGEWTIKIQNRGEDLELIVNVDPES